MPEYNALHWETLSENDNDYFDVLRSIDGYEFNSIGTIDGVGNSTSVQNYSFLDKDIRSGITYYQLEQVDIDGTRTKSDMIALDRDLTEIGLINAWPNPVSSQLTIEINNGQNGSSLELRDIHGKLLREEPIYNKGFQTFVFDLETLSKGMYVLHFIQGNGFESTKKITKQ